MNIGRAQEIALLALGWLASNDDLLPVFLGASGASLEDLRTGAAELDNQASVLDFLLMEDEWIIACCDTTGVPYGELAEARQTLPGGALPNWT